MSNLMELIYKTETAIIPDEEDGGTLEETIYIYRSKDEDLAEDFELLSHAEQLELFGFKEEKTPANKGTIHRYTIDPGEEYIVVRETTMTF